MEQTTEETAYAERRKRIQRLKRGILMLLAAGILCPILLCVILFFQIRDVRTQLGQLQEAVADLHEQQDLGIRTGGEPAEPEEETDKKPQKDSDGTEAGGSDGQESADTQEQTRKVYLTFDDGPSIYTDRILDILDEYGVKATFFVVGKTDEESLNACRRIVEEGHTLGMHSYSHKYDEIYQSLDAYAEDLMKLQVLLYETTGTWSKYTRFPGGSSNRVSKIDMKECIAYVEAQGIQFFDWNISSGDAARTSLKAETITENVLRDIEKHDTCIVLMHDAADKETTVEALPEILKQLLAMEDIKLLAIDDETVPVQHIKWQE